MQTMVISLTDVAGDDSDVDVLVDDVAGLRERLTDRTRHHLKFLRAVRFQICTAAWCVF